MKELSTNILEIAKSGLVKPGTYVMYEAFGERRVFRSKKREMTPKNIAKALLGLAIWKVVKRIWVVDLEHAPIRSRVEGLTDGLYVYEYKPGMYKPVGNLFEMDKSFFAGKNIYRVV